MLIFFNKIIILDKKFCLSIFFFILKTSPVQLCLRCCNTTTHQTPPPPETLHDNSEHLVKYQYTLKNIILGQGLSIGV
jgi:hypothetical protein